MCACSVEYCNSAIKCVKQRNIRKGYKLKKLYRYISEEAVVNNCGYTVLFKKKLRSIASDSRVKIVANNSRSSLAFVHDFCKPFLRINSRTGYSNHANSRTPGYRPQFASSKQSCELFEELLSRLVCVFVNYLYRNFGCS